MSATGVAGFANISPETAAAVAVHPFVPVAVNVVVNGPIALIVSELAVDPFNDQTFPDGTLDTSFTGVLQVDNAVAGLIVSVFVVPVIDTSSIRYEDEVPFFENLIHRFWVAGITPVALINAHDVFEGCVIVSGV
jgi:hypothetical protein